MSDDAEEPPYIQQTALHVLLLHLKGVFLVCVALLFKFLFALFVRFCLLVKSLAFVCLFKRLAKSFNSGRLSRISTATAEKNMDQEAQASF